MPKKWVPEVGVYLFLGQEISVVSMWADARARLIHGWLRGTGMFSWIWWHVQHFSLYTTYLETKKYFKVLIVWFLRADKTFFRPWLTHMHGRITNGKKATCVRQSRLCQSQEKGNETSIFTSIKFSVAGELSKWPGVNDTASLDWNRKLMSPDGDTRVDLWVFVSESRKGVDATAKAWWWTLEKSWQWCWQEE